MTSAGLTRAPAVPPGRPEPAQTGICWPGARFGVAVLTGDSRRPQERGVCRAGRCHYSGLPDLPAAPGPEGGTGDDGLGPAARRSGSGPVMVAICSPSAAAIRPRVRPRQDARGCRSSLAMVVRLIPARSASFSWDRPCWSRNCRSRWPSMTMVRAGSVLPELSSPGPGGSPAGRRRGLGAARVRPSPGHCQAEPGIVSPGFSRGFGG